MFSEELEKISWEETTKAIYSKTDADVRRALGKKVKSTQLNVSERRSPCLIPCTSPTHVPIHAFIVVFTLAIL